MWLKRSVRRVNRDLESHGASGERGPALHLIMCLAVCSSG